MRRLLALVLVAVAIFAAPGRAMQDELRRFCPVCISAGERSSVWVDWTERPECPDNCRIYWDESGNEHNHQLYPDAMHCSRGHRFFHFRSRCWCRWPYEDDVACPPET